MADILSNVYIVETAEGDIWTAITSPLHIPTIDGKADGVVANGFTVLGALGENLLSQVDSVLDKLGETAIAVTLPAVDDITENSTLIATITTPAYITASLPVTPSNLSLDYSDPGYMSNLLTALTNKLYTWLNIGVEGLSSSTEDVMFLKSSEKDVLLKQDARDKISTSWAERGFDAPDGILLNNLTQVDSEYQDKQLEKSRKIMEESQKISIEVMKSIIEQARLIEAALMGYASQSGERKIAAAEAILKANSDILDIMIKSYQSLNEVNKLNSRIYSAYVSATSSLSNAKIGVEATLINAKASVAESKIRAEIAAATLDMQTGSMAGSVQAAKAQVKASLAGSAISAVNVNASIQHSEGKSESGFPPSVDVAVLPL